MVEIVKEILHEKKFPDGSELKAQICYNPCPENPRELYDHVGHIACIQDYKYFLGDEQVKADEWADFLSETMSTSSVFLPLYLYDHSGLSISTTPFSCRWDSVQIGYIFLLPERLQESGIELDLGTEEGKTKAREILEAEVREYDNYLRGEVYDVRILHNGNTLYSIGNVIDDFSEVERIAKEESEHTFKRICKRQQKELDEKKYWESRDVVTEQ